MAISVLLFIGFIAFQLIYHFRRQIFNHAQRVHEIDGYSDDSEMCIACDGTSLHELAPGAYKCNECDYVGGPGYAKYIESKRDAKIQEKPMEQRRKEARAKIEDLILENISMQGFIEGALVESKRDLSLLRSITDTDTIAQDEKQHLIQQIKSPLVEYHQALRWLEKMLDESLSDLNITVNMDFLNSETHSHMHAMMGGSSMAQRGLRKAANLLERKVHGELKQLNLDLKTIEIKLRKKSAMLKEPVAW